MNDVVQHKERSIDINLEQSTTIFLRYRLNERAIIEWAVELSRNQNAERQAVTKLLNIYDPDLKPLFREAWAWILEAWARPGDADQAVPFRIARSLKLGDRSGYIMGSIVDLVRPWPKVEALKAWRRYGLAPPPVRPKRLDQLVHVSITSGSTISLEELGVSTSCEEAVVVELIDRVDGALIQGLHTARRLGWIDANIDRTIYDVRRVYRVKQSDLSPGENEPDQFRRGLAPATKLLFGLLECLANRNPTLAATIVAIWRARPWKLYHRLWAAAARDARLVSSADVGSFLIALTDDEFWDVSRYPEFAEMRAIRFRDLSSETRQRIEERILKLPPGALWRRVIPKEQLRKLRVLRAGTEINRINVAGGSLSLRSTDWIEEMRKQGFNVPGLDHVTSGFTGGVVVRSGPIAVTNGFGGSIHTDLTDELEEALTEWSDGSGSLDAPTEFAKKLGRLVDVLEARPDHGAKFTNIWTQIGWAHRPASDQIERPGHDVRAAKNEDALLGSRVLDLMSLLPEPSLSAAMAGIASWIDAWAGIFSGNRKFVDLWLRLWPLAVVATEAIDSQDSTPDFLQSTPQPDRLASLALNSPVGYLASAFLKCCPNLEEVPAPFTNGSLRLMRDTMMQATGTSRLHVLHWLISHTNYFLHADKAWAEAEILTPLITASGQDINLWDAISRGPVLPYEARERVGPKMIEIAVATNLGRDVRGRLAQQLVFGLLLDMTQRRSPAIPDRDMQQMLRVGDDHLRVDAATVIGNFLDDPNDDSGTRESRFYSSVFPFISMVWPKETSLTSRMLSGALVRLPAKCGIAFTAAVDAIERFLTPFDCWSIFDYGVFTGVGDSGRFTAVQTSSEAHAFLVMLDRTVGTGDGVVVPMDLDRALLHISSLNAALVRDRRYLRLLALARR